MVRAHISRELQGEALAVLKNNLTEEVEISWGENCPDAAGVHILVNGRPTREEIEASPDLKALMIPFAGIPAETRALMLEYPGIAVHNLHHNASATAESALALLMAAAKLTLPMDRALRRNDWRPRYETNPAVLLEGKTVLVLGYGHIGRHAARVCRAMGMHILAIRKQAGAAGSEEGEAEVHGIGELHELLPRADVLLITLPLTDETTGLIGAVELEMLPSKAILVNVGRGAIVDQEALYRGLENGKLHAAGLDVWYNYPEDEAARADTAPADHPFHKLENVVMSPHRGGGSNETDLARMRELARLLNAAGRGEAMANKVDLKAGY